MPLGHGEYSIYPNATDNVTSLDGTITEEDFDILGKGHEYVNKYLKEQGSSMYKFAFSKKYLFKEEKVAVLQIC